MGFVVVEYRVLLTRDQVTSLILDNKDVETITVDKEKVVIMGIGKVEPVVDAENGGIGHKILTNVDFVDHNKYLWSLVTLTTKDKQAYDGVITPI